MSQTRTVLSLAALWAVWAASGPAAGQGGPQNVVVTPIVEREIPVSIRLVGTVQADRSAIVASEVAGLIDTFAATEGQFLKQGEVICRIDPTVSRLRLAEARATLDALKARLQELENGERPEELRRLAATVAEADAIFKKWEFERKRIDDLFSRGQSNPKEKHETDMEYLAAERRLSQAQAVLEMAQNGPRAEVIAKARHDVAAQEAVVQRLEHDLEKTEIRAPFDGFVVQKRTEVGEWIAGGGPVCEMVAIERVKVRADVPESAVPFAVGGAPATVELETLSKTYSARVSRIIPRGAPAARTFPVEIDLPNTDHTLLPGMFVWAHVPAGQLGKRLMVNRDALVVDGPRKQLFVLRPGPQGGQMALPTAVRTGLQVGDEIEIEASGIKAGDLVVSRANERLFGPTPVIPLSAPTTQAAGAGGGGPPGGQARP